MSKAKSQALTGKKTNTPAWKRKDFHKDTRDSFMKELDQHKVDRMKFR